MRRRQNISEAAKRSRRPPHRLEALAAENTALAGGADQLEGSRRRNAQCSQCGPVRRPGGGWRHGRAGPWDQDLCGRGVQSGGRQHRPDRRDRTACRWSGRHDRGDGQVASGTASLFDGTAQLTENSGTLTKGADSLSGGARQIHSGAARLYEGAEALDLG